MYISQYINESLGQKSFFYVAMIWHHFHISGKIPESMQFSYISDRGSTTSELHIFNNNHIEILSWPCALLTFKFLIILRISSFSKEIEFKLE